MIKELMDEIERNKELKSLYDEVPQGKFGSIMIQQAIERAEKAIQENDVVQMVKSLAELRDHK